MLIVIGFVALSWHVRARLSALLSARGADDMKKAPRCERGAQNHVIRFSRFRAPFRITFHPPERWGPHNMARVKRGPSAHTKRRHALASHR